MNDELMVAVILLLWITIIAILGRETCKAFKKKRRVEGYVLIVILVAVLIFAAKYAALWIWAWPLIFPPPEVACC